MGINKYYAIDILGTYIRVLQGLDTETLCFDESFKLFIYY